jgi:hypothetical protein
LAVIVVGDAGPGIDGKYPDLENCDDLPLTRFVETLRLELLEVLPRTLIAI